MKKENIACLIIYVFAGLLLPLYAGAIVPVKLFPILIVALSVVAYGILCLQMISNIQRSKR